jgi:hypothetical protein
MLALLNVNILSLFVSIFQIIIRMLVKSILKAHSEIHILSKRDIKE